MNEPKSLFKQSLHGWWLWLTRLALVVVLAPLILLCLIYLSGPEGNPTRMNLLISILIAMALLFLIPFVRWLCCWRNARKSLFVIACLLTLLALIHAEETWRGKRAWDKFKREQNALGLPLDMASLAPASVPDEQNFALTPIVSTCYSALLDHKGNRHTYDTNVVDRMTMPCDNGQASRQASGSWEKAGVTPSLEILQKYYRDLALKTNLFAVPPQPQSPAEDVLFALSKYDATLEELRQASRLAYSRFPLEYQAANPSGILLPHLASCKSTVQLLRLRAIAELQCGQAEKAMEDVLMALRLGDSIRSEPFLISHLVRLAMFNIGLQPVYEGLAQHRWSDGQLAALSTQLTRLDFLADFQTAMRGETACSTGCLEYLRLHREAGLSDGGVDSPSNPSAAKKILSRLLIPDGFFCQNQLTIAKMHLRWTFPIIDAQQRLVFPSLADQRGISEELAQVSPYNLLARKIVPLLGNAAKKFAITETSVNLARIAIALERYRLAHGEYPETLAPLAPQFIAALPHDIINGQPLHYRRESDGRFTLYSVGWNQTDDGGTIVSNKKYETVNKDEGDWVWRYPAANR